MNKLFLVLVLSLIFILPVFAQQQMPMKGQGQMMQNCKSQNFYDKYSKDYLERQECQEEMRSNNRVFIFDETYQPWMYNNTSVAYRMIYNYGFAAGVRRGR
jgi:hypothetical protein